MGGFADPGVVGGCLAFGEDEFCGGYSTLGCSSGGLLCEYWDKVGSLIGFGSETKMGGRSSMLKSVTGPLLKDD